MIPPWGGGWGAPSWIFRLQAVGGATGHLVHKTQEEKHGAPIPALLSQSTSNLAWQRPKALDFAKGLGALLCPPPDILARSVRLCSVSV